MEHSLHVGEELDEETVAGLVRSDQEENAKQKAFRFLAIRPRSTKEIRDYLSKKKFPEDIIEAIVAKLESLNMLDDRSFARMLCRDIVARNPAGEKLLRQQLFKKGVPKEIAESVLAELATPEVELMMALKAAERQCVRVGRSAKRLDDVQYRRKILDYLVRRGFDFETAVSATKQLLTR